jgi:hypothetical protein
VKQDCGPNALWPVIHTDREAERLRREVRAQADAVLTAQEQQAQLQAVQMGQQPQPPDPDARASALDQLVQQKCLQLYGFPEPLSRESLFRRLRCKVTIGMNVAADQAAQANSLLTLFKAIQAGGEAAQAAGKSFDPAPVFELWGTPEWNTLFNENPAQTAATLLKSAQAMPGAIPPQLAMQVMQLLQPIVQQAQQQALQQQVVKSAQSQLTHGVAHALVHGQPPAQAAGPNPSLSPHATAQEPVALTPGA